MAAFDPINCLVQTADSTLRSSLVVEATNLPDGLADGHDVLYLTALILWVKRENLASGLLDYLANSLLIGIRILFGD